MGMPSLQEEGHGPSHDYRAGSPHLKHWRLYDQLVGVLRREIEAINAKGLQMTVLEVGAGHGGYTEPILASGCAVTATEMSRPSLALLRARYDVNPRFSAVYDHDGSLGVLGDQKFSLVVCASVLHHIPDYRKFLEVGAENHLVPGGSLISIQDPLWYPSLRRADVWFTKLSYFSWRLGRGNYSEGVQTRLRRLRGIYDENNPLDMVEYHVVRSGVDQDSLLSDLAMRFRQVTMMPYWSTQARFFQRFGELLGRTNTFALIARDFRAA